MPAEEARLAVRNGFRGRFTFLTVASAISILLPILSTAIGFLPAGYPWYVFLAAQCVIGGALGISLRFQDASGGGQLGASLPFCGEHYGQ